jgi:phosphoribosylanthranilate isomerase
MTGFLIKICGLSTPDTMAAALDAGADMVGLVFHRKSPRSVSLEAAAVLADQARGRALVVALTVDPSDEGLDAIMQRVKPDMLQLHGRETPERCRDIVARTGRDIIKAIGVSAVGDLAPIGSYARPAAHILLDAKPPKDAAYPGGHGRPFDWKILKALEARQPFLLSGGLAPDTVADAIRTITGFGLSLTGVDVSSGVETAPGVKDAEKIKDFIARARADPG